MIKSQKIFTNDFLDHRRNKYFNTYQNNYFEKNLIIVPKKINNSNNNSKLVII